MYLQILLLRVKELACFLLKNKTKQQGFFNFIPRASRGSKGKNYKLKKGRIFTSYKALKVFYFRKACSFKLYTSTQHFWVFIHFTFTKVLCDIINYVKGGLKAKLNTQPCFYFYKILLRYYTKIGGSRILCWIFSFWKIKFGIQFIFFENFAIFNRI